MRRSAVVAAILAGLIGTRASADPFQNLAQRLDRYDAAAAAAPANRGAAAIRRTSATGMPARSPARMAQTPPARVPASRMQPPAQSAPPEQVQPVPMGDAGYGEFAPGETWEEGGGYYEGGYEGDYYDGGCDSCGGGGCGSCCGDCGWFPPGFWARAEYLAFWVRGANTPPLVTTSPEGTPVGQAGVLPNADILFGNERINTAARSGGRFTLGYWCDPCETLGIEDSFFFVGNGNQAYSNSSSGDPILARPFFNTDSGENDAVLIAFPAIVVGSIDITSSRNIYSNDLRLRRGLYADCCRRFDVLAGYRYFYLGEGLHIRTDTTSLGGTEPPVGTTFAVQDLFNTQNNFNGGQLGFNYQMYRGCWTLDVLASVALGGVSQRVRINGSTVITPPDEDPVTNEGGILALASNSGQHDRTVFGVLPELQVNLRYQWTPLWRVSFGYTFMALTNVVRPGDQISLDLDPAQFPPGQAGTFPQFTFQNSDVWVQGLSVGIETNF
jgi:hypothetical protein